MQEQEPLQEKEMNRHYPKEMTLYHHSCCAATKLFVCQLFEMGGGEAVVC